MQTPVATLPVTWTPTRLRPGTVIAGETVIVHDRSIDAFGRWFGLVKIGIEAEFRYPSLEIWSQALAGELLLMHEYKALVSRYTFSGQLWIWYKERQSIR